MSSLHVGQEEIKGGVLMLSVSGALDASTSDYLQKLFRSLFEQKRYKLIVDLSNLRFISSAGMSILIDANETARENGGDLIFINPSYQVRTVVKILSAAQLIPFADSREEAEKRLA
jgi:anti-sigma B factor antagonist